MKFQFGLVYRDQRTANAQDLATLLGDYKAWTAETSGHAFDGPLLIGYRGDRITWEEDTETQPFALEPYKLTFDGRLDNREEIASRVGLNADRNLPDPVLVAEAYAKYGPSIFPDLIGEFALVLWRTDTRELTFVRSADGSRPLYFVLDDRRLLWCSDIAHLVRVSEIDPKLNEQYLLEFLLGHRGFDLTPFTAVRVVEPGTVLRFANNSLLQLSQLWNLNEIAPLHLRSDDEYEERLRDKIAEAVRVRLRAKGTVFCELSGGLDSSSVVMVGDNILRTNKSDPRRLLTLSTVYSQSETCDEQYFIRQVEVQRQIDSIYVYEEEQEFTVGLRDITFTGTPNFLQLTPGRYPTFIRHMALHNANLLLTGFGGDQIFVAGSHPEVLVADSLQKGRLWEAFCRSKSWCRFTGASFLSLLLKQALPLSIGSFMPLSWRRRRLEILSWVNLGAQKDAILARMIGRAVGRLLPSQQLRVALTHGLQRSIAAGLWNVYPDIYVSHPYFHRPLVDFCLAVPITQMQRDGTTRSLLRRALAGLLPKKTLNRKGKADIYEGFARAAQRDWTEWGDIGRWEVCRAGFVKQKELSELLRNLRMGLHVAAEVGFAPHVIVLERFLRSVSLIQRERKQSSALTA
ncbi:MAG TPA: asparagine synthase-related protein [Candidatus Saccharimonadales bacterium]|jgi:asparagine synthase (glutamine-hydrolysing)|nr:asparagine synthase-related protein [Candidatus Saccharimonadales bacterium]